MLEQEGVLNVVMGCNDSLLTEEHLVCTAASCTTNCLAPVVKVMESGRGPRHPTRVPVLAAANRAFMPRWCGPSRSPRSREKARGRRKQAKGGHQFTHTLGFTVKWALRRRVVAAVATVAFELPMNMPKLMYGEK